MANPLNISLKVTGLDQAKADLQSFATIGKRSFDEIAKEAKNFAQSAATTDPALRGVANRVRQLAAASDDAFASNLKLRQSISDVERAYKAEMISAEGVAKITATLRAEHEKLANSTKAIVAEIKQLETIGERSYGAISAMAKRAAADIKPTAQGTHDLAVAMKELSAAADPAAAANMRLMHGLTQVSAALQQKIISTQQAARLEQYLREQSQATARAEAELENRVRTAAAARAQASIQAANAQKAASQISIAAMQAEMRQMEELSKKSFNQIRRSAPSGGAPAPGSQGEADLATQMRDLGAKANPLGQANLQLQRAITEVNRARKLKLIDDEQEKKNIAFLEAEHKKYVTSLNNEGAAHKNNAGHRNAATQSVSKMNNTMTQLSFQLNDIGTSLASGASPFMVLAQQGGQIFQIFQTAPGGVGGVLSSIGAQIAKLANPIVLVGAAIAVTAGSLLLLANRAMETEARLRKYDVTMKAVGGSSTATAQDMELVSKELQHTGSTAEDAQKQVLAFSRATVGLVDPAAAKEISLLARDIATALGKDTVQVTEELTRAIAGGTEELTKFITSLAGPNGLSVATSKAMKELARIGDPAGAAKLGLKSLQDQFGGSFNASLSDGQKSINSIATAWDNMLTKLEKTTIVTGARDAVVGMLNAIAAAAASSPSTVTGQVPEAPGGVAVPGTQFVPPTRGGGVPPGYIRTPGGTLRLDPNYTPPSGDPNAPSPGYSAPAIPLTPGGALQNANRLNKDIAGLNAELQARLDAYFRAFPEMYVKSAARVGASPSRFNPGGIGLHNKDILGLGVATDVGGLTGPDPRLAAFGLRQNVPGDWRHVEPVEIPSAADATGAARMAAARQFNQLYGGGTVTPTSAQVSATRFGSGVLAAPGPAAPLVAPGLTQDQLRILEEGARRQDLLTASVKAFGSANNEAQIWLSAYNAKITQGADNEQNRTLAMQEANGAIQRHRIELQQAAETQSLTNSLAVKTAQAFGVDEVEGYRKAAEAQAILAGRQGQLADAGLILAAQASEALVSGAKAIPGLKQQADATVRLAEAAKGGAGAEHEMGVQNQIVTATHDALTKAKATGNAQLIKEAELLTAVTAAQIKKNDAAKEDLAIRQRINQRTDTIQQVQLQTSMVGSLPENVEAANAKLREQQALLAANKTSSDAVWQASMANVEALNKANIAYAEAQRQQARIDSMYQQIGSTIESAIGNVIEGIFDPKKAMDWGKAVKDMAKQLFTGVVQNFFTKPLTGTILGVLGASQNVVSQFGGFGGTTGGITGAGGTTASGGLFGGGGLNLGTLIQGGSLFSKGGLFGSEGMLGGTGSSGGFMSGITDFFSGGAGGAFASSAPGATFSQSMGSWSAMPQAGVMTPGWLGGGTTLGGAAMGVGLGFAGGTMLNSLLGRKNGQQTTGMIGSGIGSLAGLALTPILGPLGPILGGLAGGALGGMFGNPRGSNMSAGGMLDLANFKVTKGFTGADPEINQQVQQMGQSLSQFLALLQTTGGKLSGDVLLQSGVNTGITVDSSVPGYEGRFSLGKDTEEATKIIEQALVKSITGVSETMKTVLSQVGTDEDIARAIQFAVTYEDLAAAAEKSFDSVEDASKRMGPFRIAFDEINALFADLTVQATRFGLALEPINAALAEATVRLQKDFVDAVQEAINAATGKSFINDLSALIDNFISGAVEAAAINLGDQATGDLLGTAFMAEVNQALEQLDAEQLTEVIKHFQAIAGNEAKVVTDLAVTMLATVDAVDDTTDAVERLRQALINIQDYIDRLTSTESFGVSPENALIESQRQYQEQLGLAKGGDLVALEGITEVSDRFLAAIEGYYGSTQQGTDLFDQVVKDLQGLTGTTEAHETTLTDLKVSVEDGTSQVTNTVIETSKSIINGYTDSTSALIANNNAVAQSAIKNNNDSIDTLVKVTNDTAAANMLLNTEAAKAATLLATDSTEALLAENEASRVALVAANDAAATAIVDQNTTASLAAIENANAVSQAIIDQNNINSGALITSGELSSDAIVLAADTAASAALEEARTATASILTQAETDAAAITGATDAASTAMLAQAEADKQAIIDQAKTGTTELLTQATTASTAALAEAKAGSTSVSGTIALWGQALYSVTEAYGIATVGTIGAWSAATIDTIAVYLANTAATVSAWGKVTADAIGIWGSANVQIVDAWGKATVDTITAYGNSSANMTAAWAPLQLTAIYDSANSVIASNAAWIAEHIRVATVLANSEVYNNTGIGNNIITAIYGIGNSIVTTIRDYTVAHWGNDTNLTNSLINVGSTYSNAQVIATYGAASSIIGAEAIYTNNMISSQASYGNTTNYWMEGIYNATLEAHRVSIEQNNKIIYILQGIYDGMRLLGQNWGI